MKRSINFILLFLSILAALLLLIILYPSLLSMQRPDDSLRNFTLNKNAKKIIDTHVHVAGLGYGDSGCFIGKHLSESYKKGIYLRAFGVSQNELEKEGDQILVKKVSEMISNSRFTDSAVILAMDGYFERDGTLNMEKTQIYVPNEYVISETKKYPNLIFGASVNPYRKDALERLREAKRNGAVLIKWIPAIMNIDPADDKLIPFYQTMKEIGLPLLSHAGQESAFAFADDTLGDPLKLKLPLETGVQVIAAHVATTGKIDGQDMIDRLLPLFNDYPNLYADISSLTQINKLVLQKNLWVIVGCGKSPSW